MPPTGAPGPTAAGRAPRRRRTRVASGVRQGLLRPRGQVSSDATVNLRRPLKIGPVPPGHRATV